MRFGIIGAMEGEISQLKSLMEIDNQRKIGGMMFKQGLLEGIKTVLVQSGIGKVNGALCAHILINVYRVDCVIFTGVAGALLAQLDIGDIVISADSMYHDVDVTDFGYPLGQIPRLPVRAFPAEPRLIELARETAERKLKRRVIVGRVLTGDRFIADKAEAQKLGTELAGVCVEMEGAGVGQACYMNKIPYVLIRCISDKADGTAPSDFNLFSQQAADCAAEIVCGILRNYTG
ncbi:MAG: 5'-methylthioadenosine/adenosylhomocysteine nucleosidase [Firmicutes bacterium]|nr:5'-methylthioadenosine/adenosylhomocysteine nucleosidase [Bacillota bacterium]